MKTVLAVSGVIFSYFGNQLGRPDMLPFLNMFNMLSSQMKCSLEIEVISIQIFVVLTIQQEGEDITRITPVTKEICSLIITLSDSNQGREVFFVYQILLTITWKNVEYKYMQAY